MDKVIQPKEWVLPNRVYFNKWIYQTFHPSKYIEEKKERGITPDPSQKLIRDFLNYDSPYRGLLVYHGLGSGKSYSSILATESFIRHRSNVVIMTPASLENNYRKELKKYSSTGSLLRKKWTKVRIQTNEEIDILKRMFGITKDFVEKQNRVLWLPAVPKEFGVDRILSQPTLIKALPEEDKKNVQAVYDYLIDKRYTFLHYNGLTNKKLDELEQKNDFGKDLFDDAIVVIDEVHLFISRVVNGGKIARRIYNMLISKPNVKLVLLSGTPAINHPFELCSTLNLLRGPLIEYTLNMLKDAPYPTLEEIENAFDKEKLLPFVDEIRLDEGNHQIKLTLVPSGFVKKARNSIEVVQGPKRYDSGEWMSRAINKVKQHLKISAKFKTEDLNALPDKREDFMNLFLEYPTTTDDDNELARVPTVKKGQLQLFMKRISGIVSYYRIADENLFPTQLPMNYEKSEMSSQQFIYYIEKRMEEIKKDEIQKKKQRGRQENDPFKTNSSYRAFTRMACNYVFPDKISRPLPSEINARLLKRELDINEDDEIDNIPGEVAEKPTVMKEYERELAEALKAIEDQGDRYLQGKGLEESSPKMAKLIELLTEKPSKSLLYSQFRTVEGLRIFRMVLEQAGWKEIDFKSKSGGDWEILNGEEVLRPEYDGKRYLVFGDKQKTEMLISLFNADLNYLPPTIQKQLADARRTENLRGKLASLLMITQSGAEGLNLRNVRNVYILEPFWNQVRIEQVIGRAIRKGSHLELPAEERNVQVTMFLATFTKKQAKANKTIVFKDDSKTTDENIRELALRKDQVVQEFLMLLKSNAMDCVFNSAMNKPIEHGYTCFSYPINRSPKDTIYIPSLTEDMTNTRMFGIKEKAKKIKGKSVMVNNVKYVILNDDLSTLYDYNAYKSAGVLVEAM